MVMAVLEVLHPPPLFASPYQKVVPRSSFAIDCFLGRATKSFKLLPLPSSHPRILLYLPHPMATCPAENLASFCNMHGLMNNLRGNSLLGSPIWLQALKMLNMLEVRNRDCTRLAVETQPRESIPYHRISSKTFRGDENVLFLVWRSDYMSMYKCLNTSN